MTQRLDLFFDFRSPYSYLAFTQLRQMDVDIALRPMQVLKVMDAVGNVPTTITCAAKGRYARTDLGRWAGFIVLAMIVGGAIYMRRAMARETLLRKEMKDRLNPKNPE